MRFHAFNNAATLTAIVSFGTVNGIPAVAHRRREGTIFALLPLCREAQHSISDLRCAQRSLLTLQDFVQRFRRLGTQRPYHIPLQLHSVYSVE